MEFNKMINLRFGLFWSNEYISYLRYLTFLSLRKFHPNSDIELYISTSFDRSKKTWKHEKQDFQQQEMKQILHVNELKNINVKLYYTDKFNDYSPNYQSDFFRWWWLQNNSGFYLDTDQIILKSFEDLPRHYELIYSAYKTLSCGLYTPVGVIGSQNMTDIVCWINNVIAKFYDPNCYNSLGPFMFRSVLQSKKWNTSMFNSGYKYFYPIKDSCYVSFLYDSVNVSKETIKAIDQSYSLHWFGGHPSSQNFNKIYNPEIAESSSDLISCILRSKKII